MPVAMTNGQDILVGLMSGTSTDGVDAAVVRFTAASRRPQLELLEFRTHPYPPQIRQLLFRLAENRGTPLELARASFALGREFALAATQALAAAKVPPAQVTAVALSGHTVAHDPQPRGEAAPACTMQIGEPAVVAEALGTTVVSDFRVRDVAAGGQGAPLVPLFDYEFFRSDGMSRAVLNIGGIANVTILPEGCSVDDVVAFDTGPGNMPLDIAARMASRGKLSFDRNGRLARAGKIHEPLLGALLQHPYFAARPPKSCGRAEFGDAFVRRARRLAPQISAEDLLATLTELTAHTAAAAIRQFVAEYGGQWELVVSGGGAHNPALMDALARHAGMPVRRSDELGVPVDAKEAIAFAYLAWRTLRGLPANVPAATGACGPRVLGKITPP